MIGPASDEWQANSTFVQAELAPAEAGRALALNGRKRAVVAGENHERLAIDSEVANAGNQAADLPIGLADDGVELFGRFLACFGVGLTHLVRHPGRMHIV